VAHGMIVIYASKNILAVGLGRLAEGIPLL